jgi:hypothetical protein
MRTTLTSIIALGFAVTSTTAVLADENDDDDITMEFGEDQERFTDAGFEGARVMQNVEVARVTKDGETFYVVHGIGNGTGLDQAGIQPGQPGGQQAGQAGQPGDMQAGELGQPGAQDDLAADPLDQQPGAQNDLAADPLDQQPGAQDDLAADPLDQQPGAQDDLAADPLGQQPGAQDDLAADPLGQQPGAQDDLAAEDPLDQPGAQAGQPGAAQPGGEPGAAGMDQPTGMAAGRSLEDLLEEAGIEDYEILDDVSVASTRLGDGMDGQEVYVVYGIEDAEGDS